MKRSVPLLLIAITLACFGIYRALYLPGMLVGPPEPLLLVGFLLQAMFGIAGAVGVWWGARWAPLAVVLLGCSIAGMALIEGFVLGIIAYLHALVQALVGALVALLVAPYVSPSRSG